MGLKLIKEHGLKVDKGFSIKKNIKEKKIMSG
jgi:hypothetical protein